MEHIIKKYHEIVSYSDLNEKIIALNNLKFELMNLIVQNNLSKSETSLAKDIIKSIVLLLSSDMLLAIKENVFFSRSFEEVNKSLDLMYNVALRSDWSEDNETRNMLMDSYESIKKLLLFTNNTEAIEKMESFISYYKFKN